MFCKDLSQRIRWLRWDRKKKSYAGVAADGPPQKKLFVLQPSSSTSGPVSETGVTDYISVEELAKEFSKKQPNEKTIQALLKETHEQRMNWIRSLPGGKIKPILQKFPLFEYGKYVMYEFKNVIGNEEIRSAMERFLLLQDAVEKVMGSKGEGNLRMLPVVNYMEENVLYQKPRVSLFTRRYDVPNVEIRNM